MKCKKGELLTENIIFIILNLVFLTILALFVVSNSGEGAFLEEKYAKQTALLIDSAKPGTIIELNMEDAFEEARKNDYSGKLIQIRENEVVVNLKGKQGHSYSFFNNVEVSEPYPDGNKYIIPINEYK